MKKAELIELLDELRAMPAETEVVEFKEAKNQYDFNKLGKYFSALSNEANLKGLRFAWLVFGIKDIGKTVVGTNFRLDRTDLDKLKGEVANKTTNRITFMEIFEVILPEGRVVLFQIPAAPRGMPVAWESHYYGRDGEELGALNTEEYERIRSQQYLDDWSIEICRGATIADLDPMAIKKARANFLVKNKHLEEEIDGWDDATFLNKAELTIQGRVTRTAVLLLGHPEAEHFISPSVARITWIFKDKEGTERDYAHFSCPLILAVEQVFGKIRNFKYRYMKSDTLFPDEVDQYEPFVIREALHNCIAHQDYKLASRINVIEREDELLFTNAGSFLPLSVDSVIEQDAPQEFYRNRYLARAMVNLNMIDTIGSGIKRMFQFQRKRFFPLPDYETGQAKVQLRIMGKVLDMDYARLLVKNPTLSLQEIIILDRVQKRKPISDEEAKSLKSKRLIEGRKPSYFISASVIAPIGDDSLKVEYINARGLNDQFYKELILGTIRQFPNASRQAIDKLILLKLPDILSPDQKKNKINNLLSALRDKGQIRNDGSSKKPRWNLVD